MMHCIEEEDPYIYYQLTQVRKKELLNTYDTDKKMQEYVVQAKYISRMLIHPKMQNHFISFVDSFYDQTRFFTTTIHPQGGGNIFPYNYRSAEVERPSSTHTYIRTQCKWSNFYFLSKAFPSFGVGKIDDVIDQEEI